MKRFIYILLFVPFIASGQYYVKGYDGTWKVVTSGGSIIKAQLSDIPSTPPIPPTPPSDFTGTILKQGSFDEASGAYPRENVIADWQAYLQSGDLIYSWNTVTSNDSCIIVTNDGGYTDTVQQTIITDGSFTRYGVEVYGDVRVNHTNNSDDTLTDVYLSYYLWLGEGWNPDLMNGGKMPGLGGSTASKGPGVYGAATECGCDDGIPWCDAWMCRGGVWGNGYGIEDDLGFYTYFAQEKWRLKCNDLDYFYGFTYTKDGVHFTGSLSWELEKWYKITHRIHLNTVGEYDGFVEWFRNDTCYLSFPDLKIRDYSYETINFWWMGGFAGGSVEPAFQGTSFMIDDVTLFIDETWNAEPVDYGNVMTNIPPMPTPNTAEEAE